MTELHCCTAMDACGQNPIVWGRIVLVRDSNTVQGDLAILLV